MSVAGSVPTDYLEAFILGGTYADEQSFVGFEFGRLRRDVAVRSQDHAVGHYVVPGKKDGAQILQPCPDGLNGFQNDFAVDALFKVQAAITSFSRGAGCP